MKKIWIMNHYAADMYRDKAGRHYWFAKKLKEKGYNPVVFCANTFHNKPEVIDTNGEKMSVKLDGEISYVFVKTVPYAANGFSRLKNMLYFFLNLFPAAKKCGKMFGSPDVILASSVHPLTLVAGILIAKKMKTPCVCEIRDLWPEAIFTFGRMSEKSWFGRLMIAGEHWIYRKADALIFTKEGDTDYLKERGWTTNQGGDIDLGKCYYINNGVNNKAFRESISKDTLLDVDLDSEGKFNVVYAGIVRPTNKVDIILDAAKLLKEERNVQFLVYGSGSELERLRQRVQKENISNVKMKGFVERKYIPYILNKSNVNILNYSQNQYNWSRGNSSNKLFEYLASGKPVISTVRMGYDIIEKYRCGFSLETCDSEHLAQAVLRVKDMKDEDYMHYCNNAQMAALDFDFDILTDKLEKVIASVLK